MASGQQIAEENIRKFAVWVASKTDDDFRALVLRGVLSREDIAKECGFGKSALSQNPTVKKTLKELEDDLRKRGVLPPLAREALEGVTDAPPRKAEGVAAARDAERLKRLEQENASLRAELAEVKRALSRYAVLQEALAETGRIPR